MKVWINHHQMFYYDEDSYQFKAVLGVNWFKHKPFVTKKFKTWKGFTFSFYFIKWQINFHFVNDYEAYSARMNYRSTRT
jgi:hypothetical protein